MARPMTVRRAVQRYRAVAQMLWTPLNLGSALKAWWDPTQGITLNGSNVAAWKDRVGGYTVSQSTASNQPGVTTVNGLQALNFTSAQSLVDTVMNLPQPYTLAQAFVVGNQGSTPFPRVLWSSGSAGFLNARGDNGGYPTMQAGSRAIVSPTPLASNTGYAQVGSFSNASSFNVYDGTQGGPYTIGTNNFSGVTLSNTDGTNNSFNGQAMDLLAISGLITSSQNAKLQGWLAWRWGLQGKLPASHPYKSRAPYVSDP